MEPRTRSVARAAPGGGGGAAANVLSPATPPEGDGGQGVRDGGDRDESDSDEEAEPSLRVVQCAVCEAVYDPTALSRRPSQR